jgi:hypothetical protein
MTERLPVARIVVLVAVAFLGAVTRAEAQVVILRAPQVVELSGDRPDFIDTIQPGRMTPEKPAEAGAYRIKWEDYQTLVVVGEGAGTIRPAWIVTFDANQSVAVAYRGKAYRDRNGNLHVDARQALLSGPQAHSWSPDSFAVTPDQKVYTLDDADRGNAGTVVEKVEPKEASLFDRLLDIAQAIVSDSI